MMSPPRVGLRGQLPCLLASRPQASGPGRLPGPPQPDPTWALHSVTSRPGRTPEAGPRLSTFQKKRGPARPP